VDPYRDVQVAEAPAPRDTGIVGDIIAQFADPLAFYRELVQNAIDAGSSTIEVRLEHDAVDQLMRVSVRDHGEGMSRDTLENQLLVLFRSTKESDGSKIGKFGIGFASVLAPDPRLVVVTTSHAGKRLALHLRSDLGYAIYDAGSATHTGTTVQLDIPVASDEAVRFVRDSEASLERWCRHATTPIELTAIVHGVEMLRRRIDRPLALDGALISASGRSEDGQLIGVVGLCEQPYSGFFNHGLMLFETTHLWKLSFKVQDARLGHTISRDDVRRDDAFERAVSFAYDLAWATLPAVADTALREMLDAGDRKRFTTLVQRLLDADIRPAHGWIAPMLTPSPGVVALDSLPVAAWGSARRSSVVEAMRTAQVVDLAGIDDWFPAFAQKMAGRTIQRVETELTRVTPVPMADSDRQLIALANALLDKVHRAPQAILLADVDGVLAERLAFCGGQDEPPWVLDLEASRMNPFALLRRRPLVLVAGHAIVKAARERAVRDPVIAASHLVRGVFLAYRLLDVERSRAIVSATLEQLA